MSEIEKQETMIENQETMIEEQESNGLVMPTGEEETRSYPPPAPTVVTKDRLSSSSSSSSEEDILTEYAPPLDLSLEDSDEEEIELNPEFAQVKPKSVTTAPPRNLIDAMCEAVADVERQQMLKEQREPSLMSIGDAPSFDFSPAPAKEKESNAKATSEQEVTDEFGITYQPRVMPSSVEDRMASSFADEQEFEHDLAMNSSLLQMTQKPVRSEEEEEDPEFEWTNDDSVKLPQAVVLDTSIIQSQELEQRRIVLEMKAETEALRLQILKEDVSDKQQKQSQETTGIKPATDALAEIHDLYRRGLGDQSIVAMMDDHSKMDEHPKEIKVALNASHMVIEEGDEAEEERVEAEEEKHAREERESALTRRQEQEELWQDLGQPPSLETSSGCFQELDNQAHDDDFISYRRAWRHFESSEYVTDHLHEVVAFESSGCFSPFAPWIRRLQFPHAVQERDVVFCVAKCPLDDTHVTHVSLLQTIYQKLTGTTRTCPRVGNHWQDVGFQGSDPATDLRGVGMLGLLQLLAFVEDTPVAFTHQLLRLSQTEEANCFPFCAVGMNFSLFCLRALRSGALYPECNREKSVMNAMNRLFRTMWYQLFTSVKTNAREVPFPLILKSIGREAEVQPVKMIRNWAKSMEGKTTVSTEKSTKQQQPPSATSTNPLGLSEY